MRKKTTNRNRWIWASVALVALAAIGYFGVTTLRDRAQSETAQAGEIVTVTRGDLASIATASGRLEPQLAANLALQTSGTVETIHVAVGDVVQQGAPLVTLDAAALERAVQSAEQTLIIQQANLENLQSGASAGDIAAAQAAVANAQASLDALRDGPTAQQIAAAEANVRAAQAGVAAAQQQYQQTQAGPDEASRLSALQSLENARDQAEAAAAAHTQTLLCTTFELPGGGTREFCPSDEARQQAEAAAVAANAALSAAQAQYDAVLSGGNRGSAVAAGGSISSATAARDAAQFQLDILLEPASAAELAAAEASMAQAEATLDGLLRGVSAEQLIIAEAQVEQARISVERARLDLAKATLTAPFDGIVTTVNVTEGEQASGPVITMVDPASYAVVLHVDEIDLATLSEGQSATVTLEAFPGNNLSAQVARIAPKNAPSASGLVTYDVYLTLEESDLPLRASMTANADLVTADRNGVLLVPNEAISVDRQTNTYTVNRMAADGTTERVEVNIGLRDGRFTEVVSGVDEGDELMVGQLINRPNFGPPGS